MRAKETKIDTEMSAHSLIRGNTHRCNMSATLILQLKSQSVNLSPQFVHLGFKFLSFFSLILKLSLKLADNPESTKLKS